MQTSVRKMGNSSGIILPRAILGEIGVSTGAAMDLRVENGTIIVTPVRNMPRADWAVAAATVERDDEAAAWRGFGNEDDDDLTW